MKFDFETAFRYNTRVNADTADLFLREEEAIPESAISLFSHMLTAHENWNLRIAGRPQPRKPFELLAINELKNTDHANLELTLHHLNTRKGEETISYINTKGEERTNRVETILYHILNHTSHHRGQLVSNLRKAGIEPLKTDFFLFET